MRKFDSMLKRYFLLLLIVLTSCSRRTYPPLKYDTEGYPTFSIGYWFANNTYVFHDSIVYQRSFSDVGPQNHRMHPLFKWIWSNDSTVKLNPIRKNHFIDPEFVVNRESKYCQLLIPPDSLERFKATLYDDFKREIVDWKYEPDSSEMAILADQKFFYHDTTIWRSRFEEVNIQPIIEEFNDSFRELGIWNGSGF